MQYFASGKHGVLVGLKEGKPAASPLSVALEQKELDLRLLDLAKIMSR
jgi:hypothetical protein